MLMAARSKEMVKLMLDNAAYDREILITAIKDACSLKSREPLEQIIDYVTLDVHKFEERTVAVLVACVRNDSGLLERALKAMEKKCGEENGNHEQDEEKDWKEGKGDDENEFHSDNVEAEEGDGSREIFDSPASTRQCLALCINHGSHDALDR